MDTPLLALLIYEHPERFESLNATLRDLSLETYGARTWEACKELIRQYQPVLVFVELSIWNKAHDEMVKMARLADQPFNVIVIGSLPDIEQYVATMEQGAFNFLAPPFSHDTLTLAVHTAAADAQQR